MIANPYRVPFGPFALDRFNRMTAGIYGGSVSVLRTTSTRSENGRWDDAEDVDGPFSAEIQIGSTGDEYLDQKYSGRATARIFLPIGVVVEIDDQIRDESDGSIYQVAGPPRGSSDATGLELAVVGPEDVAEE